MKVKCKIIETTYQIYKPKWKIFVVIKSLLVMAGLLIIYYAIYFFSNLAILLCDIVILHN